MTKLTVPAYSFEGGTAQRCLLRQSLQRPSRKHVCDQRRRSSEHDDAQRPPWRSSCGTEGLPAQKRLRCAADDDQEVASDDDWSAESSEDLDDLRSRNGASCAEEDESPRNVDGAHPPEKKMKALVPKPKWKPIPPTPPDGEDSLVLSDVPETLVSNSKSNSITLK